jgi:hypothetical protein
MKITKNEDIYTFTYHGQNGQEETEILLTNGAWKSWIQIRVKNDIKLMNIHATFTFK